MAFKLIYIHIYIIYIYIYICIYIYIRKYICKKYYFICFLLVFKMSKAFIISLRNLLTIIAHLGKFKNVFNYLRNGEYFTKNICYDLPPAISLIPLNQFSSLRLCPWHTFYFLSALDSNMCFPVPALIWVSRAWLSVLFSNSSVQIVFNLTRVRFYFLTRWCVLTSFLWKQL